MKKNYLQLLSRNSIALLSLLSTLCWADSAVTPKIVLQTQPPAGIDVAAWTPDDRFLLTASGIGREFSIWDVGRGAIVDRVGLPKSNVTTGAEMLMLTSLAVSSDGRTAILDGLYADLNVGVAPQSRRYQIDLRTREVRLLSAAKQSSAGNVVDDSPRWAAR
jgi:hypothetical protein